MKYTTKKQIENSFFLTLGFIILMAMTWASYHFLSPEQQVILINNLLMQD